MFEFLAAAAAGVTETLYSALGIIWPSQYLDHVYHTANKKVSTALAQYVAEKKMLVDIFEDKVKETPKKTFVIYNDTNYSYDFINKKANQVGRACVEIGARLGSTIAVMMYNNPAFIWTHIGRCLIIPLSAHTILYSV